MLFIWDLAFFIFFKMENYSIYLTYNYGYMPLFFRIKKENKRCWQFFSLFKIFLSFSDQFFITISISLSSEIPHYARIFHKLKALLWKDNIESLEENDKNKRLTNVELEKYGVLFCFFFFFCNRHWNILNLINLYNKFHIKKRWIKNFQNILAHSNL